MEDNCLHIPAFRYEDIVPEQRPSGASGLLPAFIAADGGTIKEIVLLKDLYFQDTPTLASAKELARERGGHIPTSDEATAAYLWLSGFVQSTWSEKSVQPHATHKSDA